MTEEDWVLDDLRGERKDTTRKAEKKKEVRGRQRRRGF